MAQSTSQSNYRSNHQVVRTSSLTPELKSFMTYYLRFIGYRPEDLSPQILNSELGDRAVCRSLDLSPWLMGAGSLAATLVIGTLLSEQAHSQLQSQEPPPDQAAPRSPTAATPQDTRISLVPAPPEVIESAAVRAARRPFREQLAEWLQTQQTAAQPPTVTALPPQQIDRPPTVAVAAIGSTTAPDERAASPSTMPPSSMLQSEIIATAVNSSPPAVPPSVPSVETTANPTHSSPPASAQPLFASEHDLGTIEQMQAEPSIVLSSDVLAQPYGIAAPERITTQSVSSAVQLSPPTSPAATNQPDTCAAADRSTVANSSAAQTVKPDVGFAKQFGPSVQSPTQKSISPVRLVALTPETATKVRLNQTAPLQVLHLSPQDYQQLWTAVSQTPEPAPTHGFMDYQQQIVVLPETVLPDASMQTASCQI